MKIFAVYFSGTGNTKYAAEKFIQNFIGSELHCIEETIDFSAASKYFDTILVAHPIYGSDMPVPMQDFLKNHRSLFAGKNLITLVTQFLFSGDGGNLTYRIVRKEIKAHIASIHINMPTNLNLAPLFYVKNGKETAEKVENAEKKINICAEKIKSGKKVNNGKGILCFLGGFLTQRLWFRLFVFNQYKDKIKIDNEKCSTCGLCTRVCPTENIVLCDGTAIQLGKCILCYRCINRCPSNAIMLFSKKDFASQYRGI